MSSNLSTKSRFTVEGSLVSHQQDIPNFHRPSPVNLERTVDGSLQLYPVASYYPAIYSEDGAFLLEPQGNNFVTWNLDLSKTEWLKGSNVIIRTDYAPAPDTSYLADRVTWSSGSGNSQSLKRTFKLDAGELHYLSAIFRLTGGQFGAEDFLRITSGVVGTVQIGLSKLNAKLNRYVLLELPFTTLGKQPVYPASIHQSYDYSITGVTPNTVTLSIPAGYVIAANAWKGGQLLINNNFYLIDSNTALANNVITVTTATSTLVADGVNTTMKAALREAPGQDVTVELYSTSTASIDWGGMQIEQRPFRTSMVYQDEEVETRVGATMRWRKSPIADLKTFGVYAELKEWRGDGIIFDFGNLKAEITSSKLVITAGSVVINLTDNLPDSLKIFIQVLESNSSLTVYVNGMLKGKTTVSNFRGSNTSPLLLTSEGLRRWQRMLIFDTQLLEGQVNVGETAKQEVLELFTSKILINSVAISAHAPLINFPPVTVPAAPDPIAQSQILSLNTATNIVGVASATGFVVGTPVVIKRAGYVVLRTTISTISTNNITLAATYGAVIGDTLIYGDTELPGTASVRFPYDPIDPQLISAVNAGTKKVTVASVLSFVRGKAFVRTSLYQDVAEVIVMDIDTANNTLTLDAVSDVAVGYTIAQPANELTVDPDNYFAGIIDPIAGVMVAAETGKWLNGITIENYNKNPVTVNPYARVYL